MATLTEVDKHKIYFCFDHKISFPKSSPWAISDKKEEADVYVVSRHLPAWLVEMNNSDPTIVTIFITNNDFPYEFKMPSMKNWGMDDVLDRIAPILDKRKKIPSAIKEAMGHDVFLATLAFIWTRGGRIDPVFHHSLPKGYSYPIALGQYDVDQILTDLLALSHLDPIFNEIGHPCPKCGSVFVLYRDACVECRSINIVEEPTVHHFLCSYQGKESEFLDVYGNYICPKCKKMLNQIGLDYDKPGEVNICNGCGEETHESIVMGRCLRCEHTFNALDSGRKHINSYQINDHGVEALFQNAVHRYDPKKLLSDALDLVDSHTFQYMSKKLGYIAKRYKIETTALDIGFKEDASAKLAEYDSVNLMSAVGKELSHILRTTDIVSYFDKKLHMLLPGSGVEATKIVIKKITDNISNTVSSDMKDAFEVSYRPLVDVEAETEQHK